MNIMGLLFIFLETMNVMVLIICAGGTGLCRVRRCEEVEFAWNS